MVHSADSRGKAVDSSIQIPSDSEWRCIPSSMRVCQFRRDRQTSKLSTPTSSNTYLKLISGALGWLSAAQTIESKRLTGPWRPLSVPRIRSK
jgi:hypothetical protein